MPTRPPRASRPAPRDSIGADQRAAQRAGGAVPGDRRPGVQNCPVRGRAPRRPAGRRPGRAGGQHPRHRRRRWRAAGAGRPARGPGVRRAGGGGRQSTAAPAPPARPARRRAGRADADRRRTRRLAAQRARCSRATADPLMPVLRQGDGVPGGGRVGARTPPRPPRCSAVGLAVEVLRVVGGAEQGDHDQAGRGRRRGPIAGARSRPGRGGRRGRGRRRAAGPRRPGRPPRPRGAPAAGRVDHRMRPARGELVVAEVDQHVRPGGPSAPLVAGAGCWTDRAERGGGDQHGLVAQRAAAEQARAARPGRRGPDRPPASGGQAGTAERRRPSSLLDAAVRSGSPAPSRANTHRRGQSPRRASPDQRRRPRARAAWRPPR